MGARSDPSGDADRIAGLRLPAQERARLLARVGAERLQRYRELDAASSTGRDDVEAAVTFLRAAVEVVPPTADDGPAYCYNLAIALQSRYDVVDDPTDLDEAVTTLRHGLAAARDGAYAAVLQCALGSALRRVHKLSNDPAVLAEAIGLLRDALANRQSETLDLADCLYEYGRAVLTRAETVDEREVVDEAVAAFAYLVQSVDPSAPDYAAYLDGLGSARLLRFDRFGVADDLAVPASLERLRALINLGNVLADQYGRTRDPMLRERALHAYEEVRVASGPAAAGPETLLQAALNCGEWAEERGEWGQAVEWLERGLDAVDDLLVVQHVRRHKESWLSDVRGVAPEEAVGVVSGVRDHARVRTGDVLWARSRLAEPLPEEGSALVPLGLVGEVDGLARVDPVRWLAWPEKQGDQATALVGEFPMNGQESGVFRPFVVHHGRAQHEDGVPTHPDGSPSPLPGPPVEGIASWARDPLPSAAGTGYSHVEAVAMDRRMRVAAAAAGAATRGAVAFVWHDHWARLRSTRRAGLVRPGDLSAGRICAARRDLPAPGPGSGARQPPAARPPHAHERAWAVARQELPAAPDAVERFRRLHGTGRATDDLARIVRAAETGQVESLLVPAEDSSPDDARLAAVDQAVARTLARGGTVWVLPPDELPASLLPAAVLRY